ncbi:hypothetical protein [Methanolobus chelungpuianus]|nr:hypothetical protein [Methanolobus chelungpuianus]
MSEARKLGYDEFCGWLDIIPQTTGKLPFLKTILKHSKKISNSRVEIIDN